MPDSDIAERRLTTALRAVAAEEARLGASSGVEARLLAEVRSIARARRIRTRVAVYAIAAALVLAISVPTWRVAVHPGIVPPAPAASRTEPTPGEVATDFLPLVFGSVPISDGQIVRMEVPRTALASFGLASIDSLEASSSSTILADVVFGVDGLARAVRFVRPVMN
jgi:hypothetical protein